MTNKKQTLGQKMLQAKVLLANVQEPEFKAALLEFGYDDTRLGEGQVLYDDAKALKKAQKKAYAAQYQATRALNTAAGIAQKYFAKQVSIARLALDGDEDSIKDLGIAGTRKETYEGWTSEAITFYSTALASPGILAILELSGATTDILTAGLQLVDDLDPLYTAQKNKKGLAQVATENRDKKMEELFKWVSKVIQYARIAFKDDPQQLERFMVTVYSKGYSPKKTVEENPEEPLNPPTTPPAPTKGKGK
jgi:hypothetical protein